jgi:small subunit ribosomal protein S2
MAVVTMKQLLEAGVHFGHQTRRWNPKMKRFLFGERNGIYIIDLHQTLSLLGGAYSFVRDLVAGGGTILFVGTKKQAQDPVAEYATSCGMPYVNERWLGGMLTNFETIAGRVRKLSELEASRDSGEFDALPKKEALLLGRELEKLERNLGGIRRLTRLPNAIFVIDTKKEHIAVTEANKLGLPVVAVVDTNCDPDVIDYVIPGNDDAIRSARLMCRVIADAVNEGRYIAARRPVTAPASGEERRGGGVSSAGGGQRRGAGQQAGSGRGGEGADAPSAMFASPAAGTARGGEPAGGAGAHPQTAAASGPPERAQPAPVGAPAPREPGAGGEAGEQLGAGAPERV